MYVRIKGFFMRGWSPTEKMTIILCYIPIDVIRGFLLTPIKGDIYCGDNNGDRCFLDSEDYTFDDDDK